MTRLNPKYTRIYVNGYDLSGDARDAGTRGYKAEMPLVFAYSDDVFNTVPGKVSIECGPLNAFLSPMTSGSTGSFELLKAGTGTFDIMIPDGIQAVPAVGCPVFCAKMEEGEFTANGEGVIGINVAFPNASYSAIKTYDLPFGLLIHAKGTETGANTAIGTIDNGAASSKGGVFCYQLFSSNGTVTLSVDDSATNLNNAAFAALSGATSGSIDASTTPKSGMVALGTTATVRQYLRWQLAFGTANTATFALGFIRGV